MGPHFIMVKSDTLKTSCPQVAESRDSAASMQEATPTDGHGSNQSVESSLSLSPVSF